VASSTEICNLALRHLAVGKEIANLDTEKSEEAAACRRFYPYARDQVLRHFPWPFAKRFQQLALVESQPNYEWAYAYRYPSNCITIRRILISTGIRAQTETSRIPFTLAQDDNGLLIYCDEPDAQIEYTVKTDSPAYYPPDFIQALAFRIAAYIAPSVAGANYVSLSTRALELYQREIEIARTAALSEETADIAPDSEFITVREG
jgi:hypothetical protein